MNKKLKRINFVGIWFIKIFFKGKKRKGMAVESLMWIIISIAVLSILMITLFVFKGEGSSIIDKIKGLFKF